MQKKNLNIEHEIEEAYKFRSTRQILTIIVTCFLALGFSGAIESDYGAAMMIAVLIVFLALVRSNAINRENGRLLALIARQLDQTTAQHPSPLSQLPPCRPPVYIPVQMSISWRTSPCVTSPQS